jgi:hypothetical protein
MAIQRSSLAAALCLSLLFSLTQALVVQKTLPVSQLVEQYASNIAALQQQATASGISLDQAPYDSPVFYLRYCLDQEDPAERLANFKTNIAWRTGAGKSICESATAAVQQARADGGRWNNAPVLAAAPHSAIISQFLTPQNALTTTSSQKDLVYCIRAGKIDDTGLMEAVSVDQLVDFFLYIKEVNSAVCNQRSTEIDQLLQVVTANDLKGVKLIGGSAAFRQALSASSKQANELYPSISGPTLLLNLPPLLSALVRLFTPLFPPEVSKRLKFAQGPLKTVASLEDIAPGGSQRETFLKQIDDLIYQSK